MIMRNLYRCVLTLCFIVAALLMQSFLQTTAKINSPQNQTASTKSGTMLGLRLAVYHVNDIEKAKLWYARILETKPNFDQPFYVGFSVGAFELGLVPEKGDSAVKPVAVVAYWGVEDAKASYKRLIDMGAKPGDPVTDRKSVV